MANINISRILMKRGNTAAANVTRQYCYIGRSEWAGDGMFQGSIGAVLIYSRALTGTEMLANFNGLRSQYGV